MKKVNFTAVLFRLANTHKDSIMCIEISKVHRGIIIIDKRYWLINPQCEFDFENAAQREFLTAENVKDCPTFPQLWPEIKPYIEGQVLVTQNTGHVIRMLIATLKRYELPLPNFTFFDSKDIARKVFGNFISYDPLLFGNEIGIPYTYGLGNFAEFVSKMMLKIFAEIETSTFEEIEQRHEIVAGKVSEGKYYPYHAHIPYRTNLKTTFEEIEINYDADASHPLYGKCIVFTGTLPMDRKDAAKIVAQYGAVPQVSVTKNTDILVIGDFDARKYAGGDKSGKVLKAEKILKNGGNIEIINRADFLEWIN
jgi:DNA polymerase-3 subunit epsilon